MKTSEQISLQNQLGWLKNQKVKLSWHNVGDDDPTGEFNTVREKRRYLNSQIANVKLKIEELKNALE